MKKDKEFVQVTTELLKALHKEGITNMGAQLLFAKICNLSIAQPCTASNAYFAEFFGISVSTVHKYLRILAEAGLITRFEQKDEPTHTMIRYIYPKKELFVASLVS